MLEIKRGEMNMIVSYKCTNCDSENLKKDINYNDLLFDLRLGTFNIINKNGAKVKDTCNICGAEQIFDLRMLQSEEIKC